MMPTNQEEKPTKQRSRNRKAADRRNPKKTQSLPNQVKRAADPVIADTISAMTAPVEEAPIEEAPVEVPEVEAMPTEPAPVEFVSEQAASEQAAIDVAPIAAMVEKAPEVALSGEV